MIYEIRKFIMRSDFNIEILLSDAKSLIFTSNGLFGMSAYRLKPPGNRDETFLGYKAFRALFRQPKFLFFLKKNSYKLSFV